MFEYIVCDQYGHPFTEEDCKKFVDSQVKKIGYIKKEVSIIISAAKKHFQIMKETEARIIVFCENASQAHDIAESETLKTFLPDWNIEAITSLQHRKQRNRKDVFSDF